MKISVEETVYNMYSGTVFWVFPLFVYTGCEASAHAGKHL